MRSTLQIASLAMLAALASAPVQACGEGIFHMGDGLRFQGYLAPRPATVLVLDAEREPRAERIAVYRGLVQAGHRLTVAHDADELGQAMAQGRYDIVIAGIATIDAVAAATSAADATPRLLPVVERDGGRSAATRDGYSAFVVDGASLGQYLRQINRLMKD